MDDKLTGIIFLAISCVIGNTIVACMWLNGLHKNPQASGATKAVVITTATSEVLAFVCIIKLFMS